MSSFDTLIKMVSIADYKKNNGQPEFNILGLNPQDYFSLGCPPSDSRMQRNTQYSTPCDILANVWSATFAAIQSIASWSIVTLSFGLPRTTICYRISLKGINTNETPLHYVLLSGTGDSTNDKTQQISESYETSHSPADKCSIERNNSGDSPRRGLSLGHVHRETDCYNQGQSEQWTHSFSGPGIQNRDHEGVCA